MVKILKTPYPRSGNFSAQYQPLPTARTFCPMPLSLYGSGRDYFSSRGHILLSPILDKSDMERPRIDKEETIALTHYSNYLTKTKLGQIVFLATISASSHRTGIEPAPLSWFDIRRTYFGSPGLILLNPIDKSGAKDHPIRPFIRI